MLSYLKDSDTVVLVLHEIYGLNNHIADFCLELSQYKLDVLAPNLLEDKLVFNYEQEERAYHYFFNNIGFESAYKQVSTLLRSIRNRYQKIILIGFSVGATIAWLCSKEAGLCDVVIGLYGSRIRDYLCIEPNCPVLLIYPSYEKAFNVSDLIKLLNTKDNVCAKQLVGEHGFMSPASPNYNKQSALQAEKEMQLFINNI